VRAAQPLWPSRLAVKSPIKEQYLG